MAEKELKKQYYKEWREKQPVKYMTWLVFYYGSLIPLIIALVQLIGGLNDQKFATLLAFAGISLVMEIIAMVVGLEAKRGWKEYRDTHMNQLQKKK